MQRALWTAATGMQTQQMNVDTIANNLANVNTNGFKKTRAEFQDIFYQTLVAPGSATTQTLRQPTGIQLGLGSRTASLKRMYAQGDVRVTENPLDVVVQGRGFLKVLLEDGTTAYTRDGSLSTDSEGQLVTGQGLVLDPPVTLPEDTIDVSIARDGTVSVRQPGSTLSNDVGQIEIAAFVNPAGLVALGGNLFQASDASGDPIEGIPGQNGLGDLLQGFLENSNVSIVTELVDLIAAQRAYEMNSRAIQAADEMMQQLNSLIR